ncbi:TPA: DUF7301 family protein [Proteus mirabilis]|uniref:DUF7301 family protein n=2 Tax=Proteus TaxID=583 RepID=UPI00124962E3|nr:hypothetical protein [Proteus penneri]HCB2900664.1 hypothetical protein [Proteus mirabilis]HCB2910150.1 hypothetical protein [Proteus mirabilis]HEK1720025.1 hypothetical protein [Proteus mirabilis]HEK1927159.1 hypothetical protein [Proteus mirabilis]HEK2723978.1 hypothetical protein [Proteus mirabilis]
MKKLSTMDDLIESSYNEHCRIIVNYYFSGRHGNKKNEPEAPKYRRDRVLNKLAKIEMGEI